MTDLFAPAQIDRNDANRTIFVVPSHRYPHLRAEIEKLSAKSVKLGGTEIDLMPVSIEQTPTGTAMHVYIAHGSNYRCDEYKFVAVIDHSNPTGNIVREVPNLEASIPALYYNAHSDCDHCNISRVRRDTYIVQNVESGDYRQVGSTCLKEFFKTDPRVIAALAEVASRAKAAVDNAVSPDREPVPFSLRDNRYIEVGAYLANCAAVLRVKGWVSATEAKESGKVSSASIAYENMFCGNAIAVTDEDHAVAAAARVWAQNIVPSSNYENSIQVLSRSNLIEGRSVGLTASIVSVYVKKHAPKVERAKPANVGSMEGVIALLKRGGARLKNPKVVIELPNSGTVVLSIAKAHHKVPGSINVNDDGEWEVRKWFGRISPDGAFQPSRDAAATLEADLRLLAADPAGMAAAHGHKTGQCCFCNRKLKDARSTYVGYGATCASTYGLAYPAMSDLAA